MASDTFQHSDSDLESIAADIPGHVEYGNKVYPGTSATGTILDDYEEADQEDYKQYDHVYVIKKTYGRLENPTAVATDKPKVTTVGSFRGLRDANECAEAYLEQGRYAGIVWKKWEVETEHSDGLVNILATSDSHWYRVQVLRKQKASHFIRISRLLYAVSGLLVLNIDFQTSAWVLSVQLLYDTDF